MKYIVIEEEILYNRKITSTEKIVLAIIKGLEQSGEPVYATNNYIANVVGIKPRQISEIISKLQKEKLIIVNYGKNKKRRIATSVEIAKKYNWLFYEESKRIVKYEEEDFLDWNWLEED